MIDVESVFAQLLGRQPSEKEIQNLYRVKKTLGIRENDALWLVLMALESYDTLYRKYPSLIAAQVEKLVEAQKEVFASIANAETKKALGSLAAAVAHTSETIARTTMDAARWQAWGWSLVGLVIFGCLCLLMGIVIGSGRLPFWLAPKTTDPFLTLVGALARAPAGWIVAIGGAGAAAMSAWTARLEIYAGRRLNVALTAVTLTLLSGIFLLTTFL